MTGYPWSQGDLLLANDLNAAFAAHISGPFIPLNEMAVPNGVATLGATGIVPAAQLPPTVGTLNYLGGWNASTNVPVLASGASAGGVRQSSGNYYLVTVAGTSSPPIDGITTWSAGDFAVSNGSVWQRSQNTSYSGGTVTGPLIYTATGGTTPRAAQDRAADVANVLDFGADPTGVVDSTAAFNAAIASRPFNNAEVYIPAGNYKITDAITLGAGCVIRGAGRQMTLLSVPASFNMSALGVFVFGSDPAHPGTPTIKDLWIRFAQPNFGGMTRANLIQYPPAIYKAAATATGRPNLENLMISSAWVGIYMDNCAAYIDNIYMSAFSYGFQWSATTPTLDCCRVSNVHFWPFDFIVSSPLGLLFMDGTTNCAWFGRIDGLFLTNFFNESSIMTVDCGASPAGGYYFFTNIGLDGPAHLIINSNVNLQLDSIQNNRSNTAVYTTPGIIINGGRNAIDNSYLANSNASLPMVSVQGGTLQYYGGSIAWAESDTPFMTCSAGNLEVRDVTFSTHNATARVTPIIAQSGTGYVQVSGCRFNGFPAASVPPVGVTTSANAFVDGNNYGGMVQTLPTDYQTISYGNRRIQGDASVPTAAQLSLRGVGTVNGLESKLRFFGTFGTAVDYGQYLAASLRAGWTTNAWNSSYLNVWLGATGNGPGSDANMQQVASFTANNFMLGNNTAAATQDIILNAATGFVRAINYQNTGSMRFSLGATAGDNFALTTYDNTGAALGNVFTAVRLTGAITLGGAGTWTPNGTTAVSLTALAPAGAHATVQEWLTITDSGGNVRYIPCF